MPDRATTPTKMQRMKNALPALQQRLEQLLPQPEIPIILIGGVTYAVCGAPLRHNGWRILNKSMINHPARGNQLLFNENSAPPRNVEGKSLEASPHSRR